MDDVFDTFHDHHSSAEWDQQKQCRKPTCSRSKKQRTRDLQQTQIKFTATINPIQRDIQTIVSAQQVVAAPEFVELSEIRKLQIILTDLIPKITHRQVTAIHDAVQRILRQFIERHLFRDVRWRQLHITQRLLNHRPHPLAHLLFGQASRLLQQRRQSFALNAAQSHIHQSCSRTGQMLSHHHFAQAA